MKDEVNYLKDSKKFWGTYKKARGERDKKLAELPFSEKAAMTEKIQADYEVLRNAQGESKQFGLGEISPDAMNELSIKQPFTQKDFENALDIGKYAHLSMAVSIWG